MKTNYEILEQVRSYYAGELSEAEESELERQMGEDEKYAYHERLFRVTNRSVTTSEKKWMKELDSKKQLNADYSGSIKRLKKNDRRRTNLLRLSLAASILIVVALFSLLRWSPSNDQIFAERPDDEEYIELGAVGVEAGAVKEVKVWEFDATSEYFSKSIDFNKLHLFDSGKQQTIMIYSAGTPILLHEWAGDTLNLFSAESESLEELNILYMFMRPYEQKILFLKIGTKIYDVEWHATTPTPLRETTYFGG